MSTASPPAIKFTNNRGLNLFLTVCLVLVSILAGFFAWQNRQLVNQSRETGNQSLSTPTTNPSPTPPTGWRQYRLKNTSMVFQAPFELNVDISDKKDGLAEVTVQDYPFDAPPPDNYYQLTIVYDWLPPVTNAKYQEELDKVTAKKALTVAGYNGYRGQVTVEDKKKDIIIFLKENGIFSLYTYPINTKNQALTNSIIQTFVFNGQK